MNKYNELKTQYPQTISMDQLYRICRISKRSADYLIKHGVIPAFDTGRKTWRYRIALDDVIKYLKKRDKIGSMIPRGAVSSRHGKSGKRVCFASILSADSKHELSEYFSFIYTDFPNVLTTDDISEMTGLSNKTIYHYIRDGKIKHLEKSTRYLIAKAHLLEFVVSPHFIDCESNSELFKKIVGGFELWKDAKS